MITLAQMTALALIAVLRTRLAAVVFVVVGIEAVVSLSDLSGPAQVLSFSSLEALLAWYAFDYYRETKSKAGLLVFAVNLISVIIRAPQFLMLYMYTEDVYTQYIFNTLAIIELLALTYFNDKRLMQDGTFASYFRSRFHLLISALPNKSRSFGDKKS